MKCSLGISNFLEEISSLSHSVVFLYFFALILRNPGLGLMGGAMLSKSLIQSSVDGWGPVIPVEFGPRPNHGGIMAVM